MQLIISPQGNARAIYAEVIDLGSLGTLAIHRASHVEPSADGSWSADLSPVGGPVLGPFVFRSEALAAEIEWLDAHLAELDTEYFRTPQVG